MEDLMAPRYKVIADFWHSPFNVGEILTFLYLREPMLPPIEELVSGVVTKYLYTDFIEDKNGKGSTSYAEIQFENYPHLFRKMDWWEDRKPEEMPEYVKFNDDKNTILSINGEMEPSVHKVKKHQASSLGTDFRDSTYNNFVSDWKNYCYSYGQFLPATLSEYLNQNH